MMTALGGAVAVPSAVRSSDSTTTMRVNEVIITTIEGAIDRMVSSAISWIGALGDAAALAEIDADVLGERRLREEAGGQNDCNEERYSTRGAAGLTRASSDGRAGSPSRLRGS